MIEVRETGVFSKWLCGMPDARAKAAVARRVRRLALGNPGDVRPIGEGVSELRIHHGPGYRVYCVQRGSVLVVLPCGGDKSTRARDIAWRSHWPRGYEMTIETRPFDPAAYLDSPEAMLAYLDGAFADGDAGEIADALGVVAGARGMSRLAEETGLTRQALYKALSSDGNPEFATVLKVVRALGFRLHAEPASVA